MTSSPPAPPGPQTGRTAGPQTGLDADVIIVGAGPAGLSAANLLGKAGIRVIVLEARDELIDFPRGVGIDDESLRTLQTIGVVDNALPYTTPQHIMRLVNGRGKTMLEMAPGTREFGWPRRNAFNQPLVDRVLYEGLSRFENVDVRFGAKATAFADDGTTVAVTVETSTGPETLRASYLVGADGGKSPVRKHLGVSFDGQSPSTRFLVVDLRNDPIGTPNVFLGGDPKRPYVSLALPQSIRRFEFLLFDHEPDELVQDQDFVAGLMADHVTDPHNVDLIRARVYTHHSRIAGSFGKGRIFVIGDAAHLMPVWQGQGWNSGQRDATNLAWKLAAVVKGYAGSGLLDTYTAERKDHAKAMIDLSTTFGRMVKPTRALTAGLRDAAFAVLNLSEQTKQYFAQMKYKPMPRYTTGAIVDPSTFTPGRAAAKMTPRLIAHKSANTLDSPVGTQVIQPTVGTPDGPAKLDDVIGYNWAVLEWGGNPERHFSAAQRATLRRLGTTFVSIRPAAGCELDPPEDPNSVVVADTNGVCKRWFDERPTPVLFVRPDRFIAAACLTQDAARTASALFAAAHIVPVSPDAATQTTQATAMRLTADRLIDAGLADPRAVNSLKENA
ncbi:bifunctional 3-(3-hydroxy-phenyl)propionate/3-hydroxycinnamic acid hydroxylase [Brevibacterium moorei]|uniref:bifunctional 3-(3-hydroxy-phenyl)propionate/3-hydroxycinnamic acid hydroxylase n=1 Tax=Brevibacterium moorei TaxID=2968457 RepID=UPI00211B8B4C|nr:bifunctional 3-(3-hydroxy-phenyl)propionate/3-hydroxycinnamic acid hydroxylase [Brevibacterium sp. 68QC2CO]MCQ9385766.1 bifunctional 3-(3-hydroxy-phenyl)propionate/3-hydroxycinnamic acid hydroxylase [Brevibacterium sp. 68QC2CO]